MTLSMRRLVARAGLIAGGLAMATTSAASGQVTHVETFDKGSNEGNWTYGVPNIEQIVPEGGNREWWLHSPCGEGPDECLLFWYPMPSTSPLGDENVFTGNYRERGVTSVGIDLITHFYWHDGNDGPGTPDFPWYVAVILVSDNGNPDDVSDNWGAYFVGEIEAPKVGEGWKSYDFAIPSDATDFPPGWSLTTGGPNAPANPDWNDLVENVSLLTFSYLDPTLPALLNPWEVGLDNARITYDGTPGCVPADLNCDEAVNALDLLLLLEAWGPCADLGDCAADLNDDDAVNVVDLLLLLQDWG